MIICVLKRILHKKKYFFYKRILEVGAPRLLLKKTRASKAENITVSVDHFRDTSGCVSGSTDHFGDTSGSAITLGYIRMTFRTIFPLKGGGVNPYGQGSPQMGSVEKFGLLSQPGRPPPPSQ